MHGEGGGGCLGKWWLDGTDPGDHTGRRALERARKSCYRGRIEVSGFWILLSILDVAVDERGQLRLRQRAHLLGLEASVLEEHQRRDAAHAVLGRRHRILVDVELGDLQ